MGRAGNRGGRSHREGRRLEETMTRTGTVACAMATHGGVTAGHRRVEAATCMEVLQAAVESTEVSRDGSNNKSRNEHGIMGRKREVERPGHGATGCGRSTGEGDRRKDAAEASGTPHLIRVGRLAR